MKQRSSFVCQQCGYETAQWYGKCTNCGEWNSLVETSRITGSGKKGSVPSSRPRSIGIAKPQKLSDVQHIEKERRISGFDEFDRVMGGGIVPGSVTLLSGDPGVGKSTLLLHILSRLGGLYVTGEESPEQVKLRAHRLGIADNNLYIIAETNLESVLQAMEDKEWRNTGKSPLVVIDSIQTIGSGDLDGMAGSVGQIRYCAEQFVTFAKSQGIPLLIIGHVTKDGTIAGPKVLEHLVDTVLYLEGERFASARMLRTLKNRFGAVEEVGVFDMGEKGLREISNPSEVFLKDRVQNMSGSTVTVVLEGTRPILLEIQALVVSTPLAIPRRVVNGVDYNRVQLILAILQKRLNVPLGTMDVFVNVSGGMKIQEPGADVAIALAILSSYKNEPVAPGLVAFGELGLQGEVRSVAQEARRIQEAKRLGFGHIFSSTQIRTLSDVRRIFKQNETKTKKETPQE